MARATVAGLSIGYDLVGDGGRNWVITPGGRFTRRSPGIREMAEELADHGERVLIWDRPNTGDSDVCFEGETESAVQADVLAGLLGALEMTPALVVGGSGGARVSLLAAARHRPTVVGLAVWWVTGGVYGLIAVGAHYCAASIEAAWNGGMRAVAAIPEWAEVIERNPENRERLLAQDPKDFVATLERWLAAYCPCGSSLVPGLPDVEAKQLDVPTLVFRSGSTDLYHRRETTEQLAALLPRAQLVDPPWGDDEWNRRSSARPGGRGEGLFVGWPALVPPLLDWADGVAPRPVTP